MPTSLEFYKRKFSVIMRRKGTRYLIIALLSAAVVSMLAFNALLLWVATGPRSLDRLTPYIEDALSAGDRSYAVKIEQTWLIWDGWKHPIDIRLRQVKVLTKDGQVFSTFPDIALGLDVPWLLLGRVLPTSLTITHPVISLFQNDDHSISFGFQEQPADAPAAATTPAPTAPFAAVMAPFVNQNTGSLRKLRYVTILNADVSVGNTRQGVFCKANNASILFKRNREGQIHAYVDARVSYGNYQSTVDTEMTIAPGSPTLDGEIGFTQLMPGPLAALFSDNKLLSSLAMPFDGKVNFTLGMQGGLQKLQFVVDGGKGNINTDKLSAPLAVEKLHAEGVATNDASDIEVTQFVGNLSNGILLAGNGKAQLNNGNPAISGMARLTDARAADVALLWPPGLSPESRAWVTTNISEGTVPEATVRVAIAPGDLAKPLLPKEDIDATLKLEGGKIRYLPDHPEVSNVKGVVHIDGVSLTADIVAADFLKDTKLTGGQLLIEDLNVDNPYIKLNFEADASARDAVHLLGLPRLNHAKRLNLDETTAEGRLHGAAKLGFHFFTPRDASGKAIGDADIDYDVVADLKGVSEPGFMKKFDIKNAVGKMTVNATALEFKGSGDVNGANVTNGDIKYLFKPENGFDTFIDVDAAAPVDVLPRFGYPAFPFLSGALTLKTTIKQGDNAESYQTTFDLSNTGVVLNIIGWNKPVKEPATLTLTAEKKDGKVTIPSFTLKGPSIDAKGTAELNAALTDFSRITAERLLVADSDLDMVNYKNNSDGMVLEASGKSADIDAWLHGDKEDPTFSFAHFPPLQMKIDVGHLLLGKGRHFDAVKGEIHCDVHICNSANVGGRTPGGKPFSFRILRNPKGQRQVSLHAEDAGAFLKSADLFDSMQGGDLIITGTYEDSAVYTGGGSVLRGRVDINDHVIKDAPVLAKLLSLASLTGFFDTLQGKGIHFVRLRAPFTISNDVITVKDAKTHGAAIGLTADGTITFPKRTMKLEGTIVPSYNLNNVVGLVPLVGPLITGGEGKGLIAARYSMEGSSSDPKITVNPLAMLTPGFLRNLFDVFDAPDKPAE